MITQMQINRFACQVRESRSRLFLRLPFFGMLMMNLRFALDDTVGTAATNGVHVIFDPSFSEEMDGDELDFVIMHELMHVALDHLARTDGRDKRLFNIACDIVVNSNIMHMLGTGSFTVAGEEVMHLAPDGTEGYMYSAEEVYRMLMEKDIYKEDSEYHVIDIHDLWSELSEARRQELRKIVGETAMAAGRMSGAVPLGVERAVGERHKASLDWRQILTDFVQEDIYDYSFMNPDRRYSGELIMPDIAAISGEVRHILFMIDTSGSMSEEEITACFSEICGAIEQFDGMLSGYIGFFDGEVTAPVPFGSVKDVMAAKPVGGGGTSVKIIFDYVNEHMKDEPPASIIILTDGYVHIPDSECANGIPVLWIMTSPKECVSDPQWGVTARLDIDVFDD